MKSWEEHWLVSEVINESLLGGCGWLVVYQLQIGNTLQSVTQALVWPLTIRWSVGLWMAIGYSVRSRRVTG